MAGANDPSKPAQPDPDQAAASTQWFDSEPSDEELAQFIDSFKYSVNPLYMRVIETPRVIRGEPERFPVWAMIICELPVLAVFVWADVNGRLPAGPLGPLKYPFIALAFISAPTIFALINRSIGSIPSFFILDKLTGVLELPRYGTAIPKNQIRRLIEVRGCKYYPRIKENARIVELGVLVTTQDGRIARYVLGSQQGAVFWCRSPSKKLVELLGVPLTVIYARH